MSNRSKNIIVIGMALFSLFFGAGNLIFPPFLGLESGTKWFWTAIGFFITGIGLPILGIVAAAKSGGSIDKLGRKVSPRFSKFLGIIIVLTMGPIFATPRTGATAFELGILPNFSNANPIIFAIIYFGITVAFAINPSDVIDKIGKILTPGLLLILIIMIISGIVSPIGGIAKIDVELPFSRGFTQGYQTMDALGATLFGGMVIASLIRSGYKKEEEQISMTCKSGIVAALGLMIVYGGLTYLGATASKALAGDVSRTQLVMAIAQNSLGEFGSIGLGVAASLACLTTAIGYTVTAGEYFSQLSNGKLSYKFIVIVAAMISAVMSIIGVEKIIALAEPLLAFIYPVVIVLVILTVFSGDNIKNGNVYKGAVYATLAVSAIEALGVVGVDTYLNKLVSMLPLFDYGFGWIVPAILGGIIGGFIKTNGSTRTSIVSNEQ
jgi:LIVCS family branched-chain amino acid:cation transporter